MLDYVLGNSLTRTSNVSSICAELAVYCAVVL